MSDLISRQAAIDAVREELKRIPTSAIRAMEVIRWLPSAQPRKGNWDCFTEDIDGLSFGIKRCSMCGASKPMKLFHWEDTEINFCPNCGSYNGGKNEA